MHAKPPVMPPTGGSAGLRVDDVSHLVSADLPGHADLAWASFPCQDLSLAGAGAGLNGQRSSSFWPFWRLITALGAEGRAPSLIALENVCGALSSHGGKDFAAIGDAMADGGYRFGAIIIDAIDFVPQSRPRLFLIGVHQSLPIPGALLAGGPQAPWHPPTLTSAFGKLSARAQNAWEWWRLPAPPARAHALADLVEEAPEGVIWHSEHETARLIGMMNTRNLEKVRLMQRSGRRRVGAVYKRTRSNGADGRKVQRAEVRFDDVAGCLRTPSGGSSRQTIMVVEGQRTRTRLLSPREAARLMSLPDHYALPSNYNEAYHLAGDGVAVPVVRFLAEHLLEPLLTAARTHAKKAA